MGQPLAVTLGDPAGIGPDITLMAWHARRGGADVPDFVAIGPAGVYRDRADSLELHVPIREIDEPAQAAGLSGGALPVLPCGENVGLVEPGVPHSAAAGTVVSSIETAVDLVRKSQAAAVVTNPIFKSILYDAGFAYPGHTEFLAALAGKHWGGSFRAVMMLADSHFRVVPVTIHVPLRTVPDILTRALIEDTVRITFAALVRDFGIPEPRIAVAGLNPHAGEGGALGSEDAAVVAPAVGSLHAEGFRVSGPHPADTLFHDEAREGYDAVVAMYHDQALIPFKTIAFETGVNVTLGLPFVRTSPDHGTAFDIAGTGRARPTSFMAALGMAAAMAERRRKADTHGA